MKPITVLLAEDHTIVRGGFCKRLKLDNDFEVVGEAPDGRRAVALAVKLRPSDHCLGRAADWVFPPIFPNVPNDWL